MSRSTKIFGVGLPRTGTTSLAMATAYMGLMTCHTCFHRALYARADAFFDTPIYAVYPKLAMRYPDARYVLTWRDPDAWFDSMQRSLGRYIQSLARSHGNRLDRLCYARTFGDLRMDRSLWTARFIQHAIHVQVFCRRASRPLLVLDLELPDDQKWGQLARFLGRPVPSDRNFPRANAGTPHDWHAFRHPCNANHVFARP